MAHPELRQSDRLQPGVCPDGEGELGNDGGAQASFDEGYDRGEFGADVLGLQGHAAGAPNSIQAQFDCRPWLTTDPRPAREIIEPQRQGCRDDDAVRVVQQPTVLEPGRVIRPSWRVALRANLCVVRNAVPCDMEAASDEGNFRMARIAYVVRSGLSPVRGPNLSPALRQQRLASPARILEGTP